MENFELRHLARIIERDSKDSTYKFALLRGTIDLIQNYPHYKKLRENRISYPMGLLVLKWIEYYYPLLASREFIPQKHGDSSQRSIAFRNEFQEVIELFNNEPSYHHLQYDLKRGIRDADRKIAVLKLIRKLRTTIVKQPMTYIGSSIGAGGEIYNYEGCTTRMPQILDITWVVEKLGVFSVPITFHHVLRDVGLFVAGTNSLIFKWADFTANISNNVNFTSSDIISLLSDKEIERDVMQARNFYLDILEKQELTCVWSGKKIKDDLNIDHALPFAVMHNNDLWNLLPTKNAVNAKKSDAIPSADLLNRILVKDRIIHYWELQMSDFEDQFIKEVQVSLLGTETFQKNNWENQCYAGLLSLSAHLINTRGLIPWENS